MYKDLRIRNANRATPIPPKHRAYVFSTYACDIVQYKVIIAPSFIIAYQRIKDFNTDNDLDLFWNFVAEDDFEVAYSNNVIPK